jgi:hypothetical protein
MLELAAGPVLFGLGIAVMNFVTEIGPLDRAKVQALVGVPLLALGPGVAGLAGRAPEARLMARRVIRITAVAVGLLATLTIAASVTFARCRPVASPLDVLPEALVMGVLAAAAYGFAGTLALRSAADGRHWAALVRGAILFVLGASLSVVVLFVVLFPPLSCAAPH